ncbi:MAG: hypothetical protein AA908_00655 [Chlorobi bacterium NICIL-2]|nr:MAG: hypothetical protein AA908_00655 [Chlorobi bacterium NICIL-2]
MFEAEIESTKLRLAEMLLPPSKGGVHLVQVLDHPSLDRAFKEFFRAEVEWQLYQDRIQRQSNLPIEPNDVVFRNVWRQVEDYVRQHARFDRRQALALIDTAVKSILNYRIRPRVTLKWFVYRGEPTKPVCEIFLRLQYFADYPYFRQGFEQWMEERSLARDSTQIMPMFEFERLVKQLDDDYILDLSTSEFLDLLDPMFSFFNDPSTPTALEAIPIEALIVFLDDKDIQVIAQKFERMLYHDGVRNVTREMILRVVEQVLQELEQQEYQPEHKSEHDAPAAAEAIASADVQQPASILAPGEEAAASVEELLATDEQEHKSQPAIEEPTHYDDETQPVLKSSPHVEQEVFAGSSAAEDSLTDVAPPSADEFHSTSPEAALIENAPLAEETPSAEETAPGGSTLPSEHAPDARQELQIGEITPEGLATESVLEHSVSSQATPVEPPPVEHLEGAVSDEPDANTLAELESLLEMASDISPTFHTETPEQRHALEREFDLPATQDPVSPPRMETEESLTSTPPELPIEQDQAETLEGEAVAVQPVVAMASSRAAATDAVLESGIRQVRVPASMQSQQLPPLNEFLGQELRQLVQTKLCQGSQERYDALIARLEQATSVRTALNELDRFVAEFNLDPKSKAAQELRVALVKRYAFK